MPRESQTPPETPGLMRPYGIASPLILLAGSLAAQSTGSVADSSPFRPLNLPTPNVYRAGSGRPGPRYWQQKVDYRIRAALDPARNQLRGRETIHYANNSPDTLPYLWLFLEQNLCRPNI